MMDASSPSVSRPVFLHYGQDELDRAYDQRVWAAHAEEIMTRWRRAGEEARASQRMIADVAYGDGVDERLDIFPTTTRGAAVHVHIHGGAWRIQSKHDASFMAPAMTAAGMHFVAIGFTNLPACRMPDMVEQLARAVRWIHRNAHTFGGEADSIFISGHSSGAHLAAVLLTLDWTRYGLSDNPIKAALCASGAYDLGPVLLSSRRSYIELTPAEAEQLSPPRHAARIRCPVSLIHGEKESPEFIRQAQSFAEALAAAGRDFEFIRAPALNHFEINEEFGRPDSLPHAVAVRLSRLVSRQTRETGFVRPRAEAAR